MITQIILQDILDAIAGTTTVHGGDLNHTVYLQQIRDAVLGVSGLKPGSLHEIIYLQQIRNAILGVPDGQFGSLPASIYLQQIVNAYNGVTAEAKGNLDEGIYYDEILDVAGPGDVTGPTCTITCAQSPGPTAVSPLNITVTFSEVVTGFTVGDITITKGGGSLAGFADSGDHKNYTVNYTPAGNASVALDVAAGVCVDGVGNANTAATQFTIGIIVTLTYQPDGTTGIDTYVDSGAPDTSQANNTQIRVVGTRRGLIKFPIVLGAGASVQSGVLSVWQHETAAANLTISIARILNANSTWNEGSTHNYKTPTSVRWAGDAASDGGADAGCSQSGVDFSSTPLGTFNHASGDPDGTKYDVTLNVSELSAMCASNNGMAIWVAGGVDEKIRSCEHATSAERPKLVIVVHYLP